MPEALLRLAVPAPAPPPPRPPFPVLAVLAPLAVSAVVWAVTGSAFALLFAALGPVVAVAGMLDGLRQRRRARRREGARYDAALSALAERVEALLEERGGRLQGLRPDPGDPVAALGIAGAWARPVPPRVVLGLADQPTAIELGEEPEGIDDAARARLSALRERAAVLPAAPLAVDPRGGIGIVGPRTAARALARELLLQLAAQFSPASSAVQAPEDEQWAAELPHERLSPPPSGTGGGTMALLASAAAPGVDPLRIAVCWASSPQQLPEPVATLLLLPGEPGLADPGGEGGRPGLPPAAGCRWQPAALARGEAAARARALARLATQHGMRPLAAALPERVGLAELLPGGEQPVHGEPHGLAAPVGAGADGPVWLDLVRDGPHALVAGTTGSGKSELLVSWALALALRYPPERIAFLLVDFKGGASFAPLAGLPHVAGVVSDLDSRRARRAMTGLRAELRRREQLLAAAGARSIEELAAGGLPRLVVMVDEYAAVVSEHPELHEVFTDLAARGRSLGVQLVLCTQRPSGVVRDAVLANVTLRIALRLADRADSQAMLGSEAALRLSAAPPGRGIVASGGGEQLVQFALAGAEDVERARSAHPGGGGAAQPWADPLPLRIRRAGLARPAGGAPEALVFGLVDLPEEQRHAPAAYLPQRHGAMLVLGSARSGRSTALAALAEAAGAAALALPARPAEAWGLLDELLPRVAAGTGPRLVLLDDLDELLLRSDPVAAPGLLERLEGLLRAAPSAGTGVALSARGAGAVPGGLLRLVESRLVLRLPSRDELLLAGLDARDHDPDQPPGSGRWRGRSVQVALPDGDPAAMLAAVAGRSAPVVVRLDRRLAVVSARPAAHAAAWRAGGLPVVELGGGMEPPAVEPGGPAVLLVGDPDAWQAAWALLASARRELPFLVDRRVAPGELRALTRLRDDPPPLDAEGDEWWLVADGRLQRARIELPGPEG